MRRNSVRSACLGLQGSERGYKPTCAGPLRMRFRGMSLQEPALLALDSERDRERRRKPPDAETRRISRSGCAIFDGPPASTTASISPKTHLSPTPTLSSSACSQSQGRQEIRGGSVKYVLSLVATRHEACVMRSSRRPPRSYQVFDVQKAQKGPTPPSETRLIILQQRFLP